MPDVGAAARRYGVSLAAAILVTMALIYGQGASPAAFFSQVSHASFGSMVGLLNVLRWATPLTLSGLAFSYAYRAGVFNMGVEGQIYVGAFVAALVGRYLDAPGPVLVAACLIAGMAAAMLWALPAAKLLERYGVNEVVTTLMLNYIAVLLCNMVTRLFFLARAAGGNGVSQTVATEPIRDEASLAHWADRTEANSGYLFALGLVVILAFVLARTRYGFELKSVGENPSFARFAGIAVERKRTEAILVSAGIGGLIGVLEVIGVLHRYEAGSLDNMGFNGLLVGLVGLNEPLGIALSGLFFGVLQNTALAIAQLTSMSSYMILVVTTVFILLFAADPLRRIAQRRR